MINYIQKYYQKIVLEKHITKKVSKTTIEYLQRDIHNLTTSNHIKEIREVLQLCYEDFNNESLYLFLRNLVYRKHIIKYVETNLSQPVKEFFIKEKMKYSNSMMVLDAIELYIEINTDYYELKQLKSLYTSLNYYKSKLLFRYDQQCREKENI